MGWIVPGELRLHLDSTYTNIYMCKHTCTSIYTQTHTHSKSNANKNIVELKHWCVAGWEFKWRQACCETRLQKSSNPCDFSEASSQCHFPLHSISYPLSTEEITLCSGGILNTFLNTVLLKIQ